VAVAGARARADVRHLDLAAIEASLRALQAAFPGINPRLMDRRDQLDDEVVRNMLAGYAFVDWAVTRGIDLFAMGNLRTLLEINRVVLCGQDEATRQRHAEHLRATEERFYGEWGAGIRDVVEWYETHRGDLAWMRAAGVYIRVLSEPQLFLEGNHRSGALLISYILLREGKPPFVVTPENAQAFFDPSTLIKKIRKRGLVMQFRMPGLKKKFARFLKQECDPRYLSA
jgi:hypothetical protein